MSKKSRTFAAENKKEIKMVQTQSYSNVLNLAFMLPIKEQRQLIRDVQINLDHGQETERRRYSWEELRAGVQEAEEQIAKGACYTSDEDDRLFDELCGMCEKSHQQ